jgi:large subunit ribosomal protein L15
MPHKLKKTRKRRGSRTMGYGRVGQHRKSGGRGGRGRSGGRNHYWIRTVKYEPKRFRKIGFKPPSALRLRPKTINVGDLLDLALRLYGSDALKSGKPLKLDLGAMGYGKLLGEGEVSIPLRVVVPSSTEAARKKIEEAGGELLGEENG